MKPRSGFTLIELMVAIALTLFIMLIMSQAFVMSLETFSGMKGIGDMQVNLRTAETLLRDDLSQDHFTGKRRLSDLNADNTSQIVSQPLLDGFFVVRRSSALNATAAYVTEGNGDANGMPSFRAVDQMIYMTVKRKGNRLESFYTTAMQGDPAVLTNFFNQKTAHNMAPADLANSTWAIPYTGGPLGHYASQWAEVLYYLVRTGTTDSPADPTALLGTPTYALYRAQFVMVPDSTELNTKAKIANGNLATFVGMSCNPGANNQIQFYSPADAVSPAGLRVIPDMTVFNPDPTATALGVRVFAGATLVCPNVLSFHVQIMPIGTSAFVDVPNNTGQSYGIYDTTKLNPIGVAASYGTQQFGLKGIQCTLRVWDLSTRQSRQATFVQDL